MSDTPRTDEQINGKTCTRFALMAGDSLRDATVQSEFARTLERELNEVRDRQWADAIHSCHNECARPMCVLRRERDEAIAALTDCVNWANGREDEWGDRAESAFNFLHRFLAKRVTEPPQPSARNCRECFGNGQVEVRSGPYMRECPECNGTGKQTSQPKP